MPKLDSYDSVKVFLMARNVRRSASLLYFVAIAHRSAWNLMREVAGS